MDPISSFFAQLDPTLVPLGAIVTFAMFSLLRGWVVPRQVVEDRIADKNAQILSLASERDDWKSAYIKADAARLASDAQNAKLIEGAETTNKLMESLRNHYERDNSPLPPSQARRNES